MGLMRVYKDRIKHHAVPVPQHSPVLEGAWAGWGDTGPI